MSLSSDQIVKAESSSESSVLLEKNINFHTDGSEYNTSNEYLNVFKLSKKNVQVLDITQQLSFEVQDLQKRLGDVTRKDIENASNEISAIKDCLKRSSTALQNIMLHIQMNNVFVNSKQYKEQQKYVNAAAELSYIANIVNTVPEGESSNAIKELQNKLLYEVDILKERMRKSFEENVKIVKNKRDHTNRNSINIQINPNNLGDAFLVLGLFQNIPDLLNNFCKFLWENICKQIINNFAIVEIKENSKYHILTVVITNNDKHKQVYQDKFKMILQVFQFLNDYFNYEIGEKLDTMQFIGGELQINLANMFYKNYFKSIHTTMDQNYSQYKKTIFDTKSFQNKLIELKIFDKKIKLFDSSNEKYFVFINTMCDQYCSSLITLMKSYLLDTVKVGTNNNLEKSLDCHTFPECLVSRGTVKNLEETKKMLNLAVNESGEIAKRVITTVQSIFYQYGNIVYGHNEKFLQSVPQQVALYRNNCMYIAYKLDLLNKSYKKKFSNIIPDGILFKDQPHHLRTIGGDTFLAYVEQHINSMEAELYEHRFVPEQLGETLCLDIEKSLQRCLRQCQFVKLVWNKMLPLGIYRKTLSYLVNAFCVKLIDVVVQAETISTKNAERLVEIYDIILKRGPTLFSDSQEINLCVESWGKFKWLVFILGANLFDINNKWEQGQGFLRIYFTADEIKHLVCALFPNNERRSAVLSQM